MQKIEVAVGVVIQNAQVLISKRHNRQLEGGLWEFPGGKLESGEIPEQALQRELAEEVDLTIQACEAWLTIDHCYENYQVRLHVLRVKQFSGVARGLEGQMIQWVPFETLEQYKFPAANQTIIKHLHFTSLDDSDFIDCR